MNFTDLLQRSNIDVDTLKASLPVEYVVMRAGLYMERQSDGRLTGFCPFHPDSVTPNFAIFGERLDRVGCWACDFSSGDVLDFIQRFWNIEKFPDVMAKAIELYKDFQGDEHWVSTPPPEIVQIPRDQLIEACRRAYTYADNPHGLIAVEGLLAAKGLPMPAEWLHREFFVGAFDEETVVMPHMAMNEDSTAWEVSGYKTRIGTRHPFASSGSKFPELYGSWRDKGRDSVIICEGESDTFSVAWYFRDKPVDVFGLPAGAAAIPKTEWIERLAGRDVVLLFDGDRAGREAALRWWAALKGRASLVRIAGLEDGTDASTCSDIGQAVEDSLTVPVWNQTVLVEGGRYVRPSKSANIPISNWVLEPERLVIQDGSFGAVEGTLPNGKSAVLATSDFESEAAMTRWANEQGYSWYGSKKDVQAVLEHFQYVGPFLARGRSASTAGFHEGHFVLPNQTIGPQHWVYVPPVADISLQDKVTIKPGPCDPQLVPKLLALRGLEVTSPILAWMAAAPLRSLCKFFPPLGVIGGSGYGKTIMLEEVLLSFGWKTETGLTDTTPYAAHALVAATNGIPIWFDEYRANMPRPETREAIHQILRAAWDGTPAVKGGLQSNLQALTFLPASAPLIVSGEDAFTEVSHIERMVVVPLSPHGKNPDALAAVRASHRTGFGHLYLSWIVERWWAGTIPVVTAGDASRQETVHNVLRWGWDLLSQFCGEVFGYGLPELDLSLVKKEAEESIPPIIDAVVWGLEKYDRDSRPICWLGPNSTVCVRVRELVSLVKRESDILLPGGERSVTKWLQDRYGGAIEKTPQGRALVFPLNNELARFSGLEVPG